ncbi:type VI secretion system Vgr family protein [Parabacteroides pacaensis]|uniref:type VI secretion system Vgr family protein n=1 Tax=Parabacteroides pacaensis TaxID=2086575 RepID=UPI000D0E50FC|nr:phage baseplate assembly protein V [Parabacteroides pacaensis]
MQTLNELQVTAEDLKKTASKFEAYSSKQPQFDTAKTNLAKEVSAIADAVADAADTMSAPSSSQQPQSPAQITVDGLKISSASVAAMQDALTGKVSVKDMSSVANNAVKGYDALYSTVSQLNPAACTAFVAAFEKAHPLLFDAGSQIKNNSASLLSNVDKVMTGTSGWGGHYGEPDEAMNKINANVLNITAGTAVVAKTLQGMTDSIYEKLGLSSHWLSHYLKDGVNISANLGGALAGLSQAGASGIGSFYSAKAGVDALSHGNIASATGYFSSVISGGLNAAASIVGAAVGIGRFKDQWTKDHTEIPPKDIPPLDPDEAKKEMKDPEVNENNAREKPPVSGSQDEEDYSADMIYEINIVLDGNPSSQNSYCTINGIKYKLSGYSLSQELLQPILLGFSIEKEDKTETQSDVVFADTTQLIGKSFEMNVSTMKTSQEDSNAKPKKAFVFRGMVIDVSASRMTASSQSASVTVASWDALLQNSPHCRSFENMTLKDIVTSVLKPYTEVKHKIDPRFKEKIPYIVQYNQSDYSFISMLAIRFGEWMYSTGEEFIFGEMDESNPSTANLEYPGGSLMSYNLHQSMIPCLFNHLLPDHYQYGKDKAIIKESSKDVADGNVNNWTDKAYNASQQRFKDEKIVALSCGGFDNGKDEEGADTILDYSLKIEVQGKKSGMMTVQGFSKLAMLKIGQTFLIRDNVQNKSGESKDVEQKALKIIGVNHSFDYRQEYSNSFIAIPVACNYPAYSDADVHSISPPQRARVVENKDEQKLGRIRVQFPWQEIQDKKMKTPWLRIAVPYAGKGKGLHFIPEIGEEVMVGFEMNNAERPYIIGSLYNGGEGKPDEVWATSKEENGTDNNIKAIRTRNGHTVLFNDKGDAGLIEIYDSKDNTYHITLSADDKKITIYSAGEIEVKAESDINISSKGAIDIDADGDIDINSKGNISMVAQKEVSIQASKVKVR